MGKPRVVPDEDHEVMYQRVAAVDVAKASGVVCLRAPDPARPGRFTSRIWDDVPATRARIAELGAELLVSGVQMVTLESTSDYWRIWYYVLEGAGLAVQLVSASQAKNLKGRPKTDKLDAMWLARLTQAGMLRPSFVPPAEIRRVRDFTRARTDLVAERTRCLQRLEKLLEDAMIKVTAVAADGLKAKSVVAMVQALIAGERDPRTLADLAKGRLRARKDALAAALDGMFDSHHGVIAGMLLDQVAFLDQRITVMEDQAIAALAQVEDSWGTDATGETGPAAGTAPGSPVLAAAHRLAEIPGISVWLAIVIIAESGSPGASPRQGPLRTVRARHPGTRLKQAPRASRARVLASCAGGPGARGRRRCVSGGFGSRPACHARPGRRGSRRRSPCGPR